MDDKSWRPSLGGHYPTSSLTIAAYRSPSLATRPFVHLLSDWRTYSGTDTADFPKSLCSSLAWVAYKPLCNSILSATPGSQSVLIFSAPSAWPAPVLKGSALSQNEQILGAMVQIQGIHPSPRCTRLSSLTAFTVSSLHFRAADYTLLGRASRRSGSLSGCSIARLPRTIAGRTIIPLPRTLSENFSPGPPLIFLPLNNYAGNSPVF